MTQKLGRIFRVTIDMKDGGPIITVTMPFTIRFWIQRLSNSDLSTMSIDIFNLSEDNRRRLYQDHYDWALDTTIDQKAPKSITIEAGYQNLFQIFSGNITQAYTVREGTNLVTRIEAQAARFAVSAAQTFKTLESGNSVATILKTLIGEFKSMGLSLGAVGDFPTIMNRPVVLNGSTWDLLKKYSDGNVYIDNGKIYCLQKNEVLKGDVYEINDATGLLETPRRSGSTLVVTCLLEPGVEMYTFVKLTSKVNPVYDGTYRVNGIRHEGTISGAVSGRAVTILRLQAVPLFKKFVEVEGK